MTYDGKFFVMKGRFLAGFVSKLYLLTTSLTRERKYGLKSLEDFNRSSEANKRRSPGENMSHTGDEQPAHVHRETSAQVALLHL